MVCPSERPRLDQGLSRHHRTQVEGFQGPMCKVPEVMTREGGVLAPCTHLQHLVDSEVLLEQKGWSDTPGLASSRRGIRNGLPRELISQRYRLPEPEGDRVLGNLLLATSCGDVFLAISFLLRPAVTNSRSHRGRCAAVRSR